MRFYDFMTAVWCVLWGASLGVAVYAMAAEDPGAAWPLGAVACVGGVLLVWCWRIFKDPR